VTITQKGRPGHVIRLLASSEEGPPQVLFIAAAPRLRYGLSTCACVLCRITMACGLAVY